MNLRIAEAQPLFCKERYIVSGGSTDCLCLYIFLCADRLEKATVGVIESGKMTKDLALITSLENPVVLNSQEFIQEIRKELEK